MGKEVWKVVPGFDLYEVSNYGQVRCKEKIIKNTIAEWNRPAMIMKPSDNGKHYKRVELRQEGKKKRFYVHRLVALLFVPNPDGKPCVNHIDCDPSNNSFENLEWCTHKENMEWMKKQGRSVIGEERLEKMRKAQEKYHVAVIGKNVQTGEIIHFPKLNDVKKQGFQPACVSNCCNGIRKTHKGYVWERYEKEWLKRNQ